MGGGGLVFNFDFQKHGFLHSDINCARLPEVWVLQSLVNVMHTFFVCT